MAKCFCGTGVSTHVSGTITVRILWGSCVRQRVCDCSLCLLPLSDLQRDLYFMSHSAQALRRKSRLAKYKSPGEWWWGGGGAFLYLKLNMDSERREQTRGSPLNWQTHCIFTMFGPAEKKHRQSELTVSTLFLWVLPLGGAPGESGSRQHVASRWANPACLHHFQKSPAVFG